jgi:hypothetical protein
LSQVLDLGAQAFARSSATFSQQDKNNQNDAQRSRVSTTGFICTVASYPSRRCTFDKSESLAVTSRRRERMFQLPLRRTRLRQKNSAWASSGPAGGRRVVTCLGRWRALPLRGPQRRFERPYLRWIAFLNTASTFKMPITTHNHLRSDKKKKS